MNLMQDDMVIFIDKMKNLKQILMGEVISIGILFSSGCAAVPMGYALAQAVGQRIELEKEKSWKRNNTKISIPPIEKCLVAVPYIRDAQGKVTFLETEETYRASQERLVPYNGNWIPWKEKDRILRGKVAELESQLKYSEIALNSLQRQNLEKLKKYESKADNLEELERLLEDLRREVINPNLEARLRYEQAKREYETKN